MVWNCLRASEGIEDHRSEMSPDAILAVHLDGASAAEAFSHFFTTALVPNDTPSFFVFVNLVCSFSFLGEPLRRNVRDKGARNPEQLAGMSMKLYD